MTRRLDFCAGLVLGPTSAFALVEELEDGVRYAVREFARWKALDWQELADEACVVLRSALLLGDVPRLILTASPGEQMIATPALEAMQRRWREGRLPPMAVARLSEGEGDELRAQLQVLIDLGQVSGRKIPGDVATRTAIALCVKYGSTPLFVGVQARREAARRALGMPRLAQVARR